MKTKEKVIKVWVHPELTEGDAVTSEVTNYEPYALNKHMIPAKLIIELPEKKIEISESEFEAAFKDWEGQGSTEFFKTVIKKKLFGDEK